MKKPSVGRGPADVYAMHGERIVEISDNNGAGLGALMSVAYTEDGRLFLRIYRLDEGVTVTVEGHTVTPTGRVLDVEEAHGEALAEHAGRMTGYCQRCGEYLTYDGRKGLVHEYSYTEAWAFCPDENGRMSPDRHVLTGKNNHESKV